MIAWSDDQRALRESFAPLFAALGADDVQADRDGAFPRAKWDLLRRSGLLRLPFATEWGGLDHDLLTTMHVLEGLGHGCRDGGLAFSVSTHIVSAGIPLQRFGSRELQRRHMARICDGSAIGAHAITEPDTGSDAMSMRTSARVDGDDYLLDGRKLFVSNGPVADVFVVYARTGPGSDFRGVTAFLVERGTPGFTAGPSVEKMGLRTSPFGELTLEGCRVPRANVIGRPGGGFLILEHVMAWEILCLFAIAVGRMQHRLERCVRYATERRQFGRAIGSFQSVSNRLVDMKIGLETSRKWLYDTAQRHGRRENVTMDVAIAKLITSEADVASAAAALQIFGGRGYLAEHGIEKDLRDALAGTIYSGTSEMQRRRIATLLGLPAS
jgi:alkylation response protein AidB-like acyl-CoA dehydrogenase